MQNIPPVLLKLTPRFSHPQSFGPGGFVMREIHGDVVTQIEGANVDVVFLFEGFFDSGTLRFWTGIGTLEVNGDSFTGGGNLLQISKIEESIESKGIQGTFQLSGIPTENISLALNEPYQGRRAKCSLAVFNQGILVGDPILLHHPFMDVMEVELGGPTAILRMNVQTRKRKKRDAFYTHEDQQQLYTGDQFFSRVNELQDKQIILKG